jgi:hypothetical protein
VNVSAGQDIYETRYLLNALYCSMFLVGYFIMDLDDKLLFKHFGVGILAIAVAGLNLFSDYSLAVTDNSSWHVDEIQKEISKTDAGLVLLWSNTDDFLKVNSVIRLTDPDRVYKCISYGEKFFYYGSYKYYDDTTEYEGPTVLVVNSDDVAAPASLIEQYELISTVDNISIYYSKDNPLDINEWVEVP